MLMQNHRAGVAVPVFLLQFETFIQLSEEKYLS